MRDSARVKLNGQLLATLVSRPYQVVVEDLRSAGNHLEVEVTNVAANRIRDLDIRGIPWVGDVVAHKHGYGLLNIGSSHNRLLDASAWPVREAGLFGPVTLRPLQ